MTNVVIVSAARTAVGSFNGSFANTPAHELGAAVIEAVDPPQVAHVGGARVTLTHAVGKAAATAFAAHPECNAIVSLGRLLQRRGGGHHGIEQRQGNSGAETAQYGTT